jgi:hypothetical protein
MNETMFIPVHYKFSKKVQLTDDKVILPSYTNWFKVNILTHVLSVAELELLFGGV